MLENQSIIDEEVFIQLIELDEDGSTEFLESVATEWFDQAIDTFTSMDGALCVCYFAMALLAKHPPLVRQIAPSSSLHLRSNSFRNPHTDLIP